MGFFPNLKLNYLWKMHGYPQFSFEIPKTFAKFCFLRIVLNRAKIFIAQNAYCFVDIYLLYGKNYRSVILAVKRKLSDSHWSKSARAVLCRE